MRAFYGSLQKKEDLIKQLQEHYEDDEIIKGVYWENGKGCAIGCAIHSNNHKKYEEKFGIPEWLAQVQDIIFEGLPDNKAKKFPLLFTNSVNIGADLDNIKSAFVIYVLESLYDNFAVKKFPRVKDAIDTVINLYKTDCTNKGLFRKATSAYNSTESAWPTRSATWSVVESTWFAVESATRSAAESAAESTWFAALSAVESGRFAARSAAYEKFADKLISLIKDCKE